MWNILGTVIRPFGLIADDVGLHIRIPEIEHMDKKKSRVLLTTSPTEARRFLINGDPDDWNKRLASVNALYHYAQRCKWYWRWLAHEKSVMPQEQQITDTRAPIKSWERQGNRLREVLTRWTNEHVPAQIRDPANVNVLSDSHPLDKTRDAIRESAFATFPGSQARYEAQVFAWNKEQNRIYVKNSLIKQDLAIPAFINSVLPEPQEGQSAAEFERKWRGSLRSALVKIIVDEVDPGFEYNDEEKEDETGASALNLLSLRDEHGVMDLDNITAWIEANWERVGHAAWALSCKKNAARLHAKREKQEKEEEERRLEMEREKAEE